MKNTDPLENSDLNRLQLFVLLTPIVGFFPALWTLYRRQGSPQHRAASRLAIVLALGWLSGHILLETGAISAESWTIPLLLTSSVLTTSYFIVTLGLMIRVWKRQPLWLPGISRVAEQMLGKHLS
ncbi:MULTISPECIES: hypothetical protein [Kamptonema]|uniref:hypothetical protein n=1 Tax=Kamptonema TaxID=1501433 RepID=UPI0001DAC3C2|nr:MULTISPECIES: hypothetical protein [Kamptonema]CBN54872.1 conserved membrane hypothetical protein [Kamptonema sp. PCC 6506]